MSSTIKNDVEKYVLALLKAGLKPSKVILFGSYAKGGVHEYSDIDLAVISPNFGKDIRGEMMLLSRLTTGVSDNIEAIPFAQDTFEKSKFDPLIGEVKKYGKIVYQA